MGYFSNEDIRMLTERASQVDLDLLSLMRGWNLADLNPEAKNFAIHGFMRRCTTLNHCIKRIYSLCPPHISIIVDEDLYDLTVFIQSSIFNTFGALDNLAHTINSQLNLKLPNTRVGLTPGNTALRNALSADFQAKLLEFDNNGWFDYLLDYRHALAHQIPLYVPPYVIRPNDADKYKGLAQLKHQALVDRDIEQVHNVDLEMAKLGTFEPFIAHSFTKKHKQMLFHSQVLQDWGAILVLSDIALAQLRKCN